MLANVQGFNQTQTFCHPLPCCRGFVCICSEGLDFSQCPRTMCWPTCTSFYLPLKLTLGLFPTPCPVTVVLHVQ